VVVHEIEVRLGIEQALRLVLAVDVRDERRELAQHAHGHERAVDGGAPLSRGLHLPPHHDLVVLRGESVALERRPRIAALDERLHDGDVFARANEVGRCSRTEEQAQRVDQDGLSRSGLAGQERQARPQLQLDAVYERDVLYFQ
jgi:hypothetical protein